MTNITRKVNINEKDRDGFLILENVVDKVLVNSIASKIPSLFKGDFETGIFPDEWHYRPGLSLENVTREMVNAWKCDRSIAKLVLCEELGKIAATLMGWNGAKVAQDDIFWKPCQGKPIGFHQDLPYMSFFNPSQVATVWIALGDVSRDNGTLEYAKGSHLWTMRSGMTDQFHAPDDYLHTLNDAAKQSGIDRFDICPVEVGAGGLSIHHGKTWHGSATNPSSFKERMSIAIHYIPSDCEFLPHNVGYIYGRYKSVGSTKMDESFFPITYSKDGYRSSTIDYFITNPTITKVD
ncbi:hypothetical protein DFA_08694 [Cavenderia fasciculata]|uniref:Phytanoyl-CoA dioxygenase n=1 Tax=Cavenderia fasciculata TaxID=261658 RepID=F4Q3U2_CACFS|nr:uncharacterized protein DFA_08694 [Cavenderia fasciculata]EGG17698.1 hypothetical protein DFA_08694 [Cavenderia fasciculata]|eukprot:XP_004356182.1 hypothetical protein DFA_08694 [Cavenderia fasciculata]